MRADARAPAGTRRLPHARSRRRPTPDRGHGHPARERPGSRARRVRGAVGHGHERRRAPSRSRREDHGVGLARLDRQRGTRDRPLRRQHRLRERRVRRRRSASSMPAPGCGAPASPSPRDPRPIHLLLTHLHMDHIQGLGFFRPLFETGRTVHIWGPPSTTQDLRTRLTRYLSPPLLPGPHPRLRRAASSSTMRRSSRGRSTVSSARAASVIHPGPTLGYRISSDAAVDRVSVGP